VVTVSAEGRQVSQVASGDQGVYRVSGLGAQHYQVTAALDGFRPTVVEVDAQAGDAAVLDSYQRDPFRTGAKIYEPGRNIYANVAWVF
jgi:hypothetical protein